MPHTDARLAQIKSWLTQDLRLPVESLEPASTDASFRRYFRAFVGTKTFIVMDAPPDKEDVRPYLKVSRLLEGVGAHVPHVHEVDIDRGMLLLEDLGTVQYLSRLNAGDDPNLLYCDALCALVDIQVHGQTAAMELPPYDREVLLRELTLMPDWFLKRHMALELSPEDQEIIHAAFEFLIAEALAQPTVFVHRDYHSRNLMVVGQRNPGIIDFQDALRGPVGYDLVSLLKDCYVSWPRERVEKWVAGFREARRARGAPVGTDEREFLRWFDMIGVQRHIKVLGIFARLWYRDGKAGYLQDLPLTLQYVRDACAHYPELADLSGFIDRRVVPVFAERNERAGP